MKRPTPRPRNPAARPHGNLAAFSGDVGAVREIARRTGLRIDATVAALVRLFDLAPESLRSSAGFPALALPPQPRGVAAAQSEATTPGRAGTVPAGFPVSAHDGPDPEAHEAPNPTIGAAA